MKMQTTPLAAFRPIDWAEKVGISMSQMRPNPQFGLCPTLAWGAFSLISHATTQAHVVQVLLGGQGGEEEDETS